MGFRTIAIARGQDKEALALQLGAHHYVDSQAVDVSEAPRKLGGAKIALATASSAEAMAATMSGLAVDGRLIVRGADLKLMPLSSATGPESMLAIGKVDRLGRDHALQRHGWCSPNDRNTSA